MFERIGAARLKTVSESTLAYLNYSALFLLWFLIPLASLFVGLVLFSMPQTVDLLTDYEADPRILFFQGLQYIAIGTVFWSLPVFLSAAHFSRGFVRAHRVSSTPLLIFADSLIPWLPLALGFGTYVLYTLASIFRATVAEIPEIVAVLAVSFLGGLALLWIARLIIRHDLVTKVIITLALSSSLYTILDPLLAATLTPRHMMIPVLAGFWVTPVTLIFIARERFKIPVGAFALVLIACLLVFATGGDYTIRSSAKNFGVFAPPMHIDDALQHWQDANKCNGPGHCPSPIVVTLQGGASRAAFATATVLGRLMDLSAADASKGQARRFHEQVFAISGVSGGSLGAALFAAALVDSKAGDPPCRQDLRPTTWYKGNPHSNRAQPWASSWEACLQVLATGDFITPVIISSAFTDFLPVPFQIRANRAVTLERAWERHYQSMTSFDTMNIEFGELFSKQGLWRPALLLNAAAIPSGNRLMISPLDPTSYNAENGVESLANFTEPIDLRKTVRLSTAAGLSARFPVISPHGELRRKGSAAGITSYVADGGFVDNYGAATALELVSYLENKGFRPIVVVVTNDPAAPAAMRKAAIRCVKASSDGEWVDDALPRAGNLSVTISGILSVWNNQGLVPLSRLCDFMIQAREKEQGFGQPVPVRFIHIGIDDVNKEKRLGLEYTLSWWLSKRVQSNIDRGLSSATNMGEISKVLGALRIRY